MDTYVMIPESGGSQLTADKADSGEFRNAMIRLPLPSPSTHPFPPVSLSPLGIPPASAPTTPPAPAAPPAAPPAASAVVSSLQLIRGSCTKASSMAVTLSLLVRRTRMTFSAVLRKLPSIPLT